MILKLDALRVGLFLALQTVQRKAAVLPGTGAKAGKGMAPASNSARCPRPHHTSDKRPSRALSATGTGPATAATP